MELSGKVLPGLHLDGWLELCEQRGRQKGREGQDHPGRGKPVSANTEL